MDKRQKKIRRIIFLVFLAGTFLTMIYFDHRAVSKGFYAFNSNNIRGEIAQMEMARSRIIIRLKGNDLRYYLHQETRSHQKMDFYKTVHIGDSIFKKAFSDSVLIKNGKTKSVYIMSN